MIDCENKVLKFPLVNLSVGLQNDGNAVESQQSGTVRFVTTQKVIVPPESEICGGVYEYPSVSCVRYKELQISLDEGTQGQN